MGHKHNKDDAARRSSEEAYEHELYDLQVELVKFQRDLISQAWKVCVVIEGRDGAGKDGTIKRIIEHLSPRDTRVVALGKPSEREQTSWYFQRFVPHLPAGGEFVLFNRSWYNRAGVEPVMGFCSKDQHRQFLREAPDFEGMLTRSGMQLIKYYLDITKDEQKARLEERREDPLKQWKVSPIDAAAIKKWDDYSKARDQMLLKTSHDGAPWHVVKANSKKRARLNVIRHLLSHCDYKDKRKKLLAYDKEIVFPFSEAALSQDLLAH